MKILFGDKIDQADYVFRRGAYAVIIDGQAVAAIKGTSSYFLPGGGIEGKETDEEALARELQEECNASVDIVGLIGEATDYLFSATEDRYFEKQGIFYLARFLNPPDKNLIWIPIPEVSKLFRQAGHTWAVTQAVEKGKAEPVRPTNAAKR